MYSSEPSTTPAGRRAAMRWSPARAHVCALLSLGILLGIGSVGTLASFSDSATASTGSFTAGTLDLKLNNAAATTGTGANQTTAVNTLALGDMVPGESVAASFAVADAGSVGLTYTATATATGNLATDSSGLKFSTYPGGVAGAVSTSSAGVRTQSCSGTASTTAKTLNATATSVIATSQTIAGNASSTVCVQVSLLSGAGNSLQGSTASASFAFTASQLQ